MTSFQDEVLGTIDPGKPGFWEGTLRFQERDISVDLTIEEPSSSTERLVRDLLARLRDVATLERLGRDAIRRDAAGGIDRDSNGAADDDDDDDDADDDDVDDDDPATIVYVDHHLDELSDEELRSLFGTDDRDGIGQDAVLSRLHLVRIGLYAEDDGEILLDYSLGADITDHVLCVTLNAQGEVRSVEIES